MIMLGVGASTLLVLVVGLIVSRKVAGDSTNFLVAGRALTLPLVAASLMGQAVDANATLGNTDLASTFGFWAARACRSASLCASSSPAASSPRR